VVQAALGPDGVLQQEMLLAQFTGSLDLLHLSTAARWLKPYRFHLGSLWLHVPQNLSGNRNKLLKMVTSLLGMQQRIQWLRIEAGRLVLPALTAIKSGVSQGKTLQSLCIAVWPSLSRRECEGLSAALISGACPALASIEMSGKKLTDGELGCIAAALRAGGLRQLHEIILTEDYNSSTDNSAGMAEVMGALEAGGCPRLTKLSVSYCRLTHAGFAALARAVRGGWVSRLQALELKYCSREFGEAAGLVEALAEGGCPSLQALDFSKMGVTGGDMLPLLEALCEPRLRQLKSLTLGRAQIARAGMAALSTAMLQGKELETLSIDYSWGGGEQDLLTEQDFLLLVRQPGPPCGGSATTVMLTSPVPCVQADSLRRGGGRQMEVLQFGALRSLTDRACVALVDALSDGACPNLTVLNLRSTGLGPLGAQRLAHAIEMRALPELEELAAAHCEIGVEGARALAAALRTGGAPELWGVDLSQRGLGDDIAKALRAEILEGCPRLRKEGLRIETRF
jgi:hypothetical protein